MARQWPTDSEWRRSDSGEAIVKPAAAGTRSRRSNLAVGGRARLPRATHRRCAFAQKPAHLAYESDPGRIARQEEVVAALERDELCPGNAAGDQPALLERHGFVITTVEHQRGRRDARQKVEDIEIAARSLHPGSILG